MSYVGLKHLLADLALEAIRAPDRAAWARVVARYGRLATAARPGVPVSALGTRRGNSSVGYLRDRGLLIAEGGRLRLVDGFLPHLSYLRRQSARLPVALRLLARYRRSGAPEPIRQAAALFNAGLFFECHELLEDVWRATEGSLKDFYHGIVQVAAAFYHYEKANWHGARTLLGKGLRRLSPYPAEVDGVRLGTLRRALARWERYLADRLGSPPPYPTIRLDRSQK